MTTITVEEVKTAFPSCEEAECNLVPAVVRLSDGSLVAVWCGGPGPETNLERFVLCARSEDGGSTWTAPEKIVDTPGYCDINPAVFQNHAGEVLMMHNTYRDRQHYVRLSFSADGGRTWSEPEPFIAEDEWMAAPQGGVPLFVDGRWVMPVLCRKRDTEHIFSCCLISGDDGATWRQSEGMTACDSERGAMEPHILQRSDGSLFMICRTTCGHPAVSISADGGETWGEMTYVQQIETPQAPLRLIELPQGTWLLAHNAGLPYPDHTHYPRNHIVVRTSEDEGATWSEPVTVERSATDDIQIAYPTMALVDPGLLMLFMLYHYQPGYIDSGTDNRAEIRQATIRVQ